MRATSLNSETSEGTFEDVADLASLYARIAKRCLTSVHSAIHSAHPDAQVIELVERGDDFEQYGFLPAETVLLADGTEIALDPALVDKLVSLLCELTPQTETVWGRHVYDVEVRSTVRYGANHHTYVLDLQSLKSLV